MQGRKSATHEVVDPSRLVCVLCGYDLRGTAPSSRCPECGTDVTESAAAVRTRWWRLRDLRWRRIIALAVCLLVLGVVVLGHVHKTDYWMCSECAAQRDTNSQLFGFPIGQSRFVEIQGAETIQLRRDRPIVRLLDPHGKCKHSWMLLGSSSSGPGWCALGHSPDLLSNVPDQEHGFTELVAENPGVVERVRSSLRNQEYVYKWLFFDFEAWRELQANE